MDVFHDFKDFFYSMTIPERKAYALDAGVSYDYIRIHLVQRTRDPSKPTIRNLARAAKNTKNRISYKALADFFTENLYTEDT